MIEEIPDNLYKVLTIQNIIEEADDFKSFVFQDDHKITYLPGQFLTLVHQTGVDEIRRSYSITSSPAWNEPLSIGVKRVANGIFSRKLIDTARIGDFILCTGAGGFFRLPEDMSPISTIFFFAAGSGIAPVFSLIKTVLKTYPVIQVFLIYSNQSPQAAVFHDQLQKLERQYEKKFRAHFLFSSMADLRRARLNRELMLEFLAIHQFEKDRTLFYTCGPAAYMRMIIYLLREQGFPSDQIKKEDFNPRHAAFPKAIPPDTVTHLVSFEVNGHTHQFKVNYPDTILRAALKEKIALPYSCETGKCGSCAARCLKGEVWLSYNEVLTEKDLLQGLTLTCVGHPVHGDVILQTVSS
ncbi:MAG: iron-sulfur cluster-binding domain-containing protein [Bacteroidota bacterium]|nr:iron-sulfur cluster-binding domain-containing protein [Bacteroidota bacterium]